MNYFFVFLLAVSTSFQAYSQCKEFPKLKELYENKKYEKCISKSEKITKRNKKLAMPYIYTALSYFQQYKNYSKVDNYNASQVWVEKFNFLKNAIKTAYTAKRKDKKSACWLNFENEFNELKDSVLQHGKRVFDSKKKKKSKVYFDYLAKLYHDTTEQYWYFFPKKNVKNNKKQIDFSQINKTDEKGLRQGVWKKIYPNGNLAYEVFFKDSRPVGIYKRYFKSGKLMALLKYDKQGKHATATLYGQAGDTIAQGFYLFSKKDSVWKYFSKNQLTLQENYVQGKLNGKSYTYFPDGKVAEESKWKDGKRNGARKKYYETGAIQEAYNFKNDKRNGLYYSYLRNGRVEEKGTYKDDKKEGKWIYYDAEGKILQTSIYKNGKTATPPINQKDESEQLDSLIRNSDKLKDPEKYRNNPEEYFKRR